MTQNRNDMSFLYTEGNGNHWGLELKAIIFLGKCARFRKRKCNMDSYWKANDV